MCLKPVFLRIILSLALLLLGHIAFAADAPATALREAYAQARQTESLAGYPFIIRSQEQGDRLSADVYIQLGEGFEQFRTRLVQPQQWCQFLILTLNIKSCVARRQAEHQYLVIYAGRKEYQPPEITYQIKYEFHNEQDSADYFATRMSAENGPMLTHNYNTTI